MWSSSTVRTTLQRRWICVRCTIRRVFEMFKEHGYGIAELNNVLYRRLDPKEIFPASPAGCEIRRGRTGGSGDVSPHRGACILPGWGAGGFQGLLDAALPDGGSCDVRGQRRRQDGGLRRGARDSGAPGIRGVRGWNDWLSFADVDCRPRCCEPAWQRRPRRDASTRLW